MSQQSNIAGQERATLTSYIVGFVTSIVLTVEAYLLVAHHLIEGKSLAAAVAGLAITQFLVQLFFFLHLGRETKPRWKLLVFGMMLVVVMIFVFGSLWIMSNLNYHMTPKQINNYLNSQDGL